jgi:drug/metabolite transporter (DMT)-like permease
MAVAIWGASPVATAIAGRNNMPPELIAGLRTVGGSILLLPFLFRFRTKFPSRWPERLELVIGGVIGFAAYPLALSAGVLKTSVTHASVILAAAPIFTGLLSFLITGHWPKARWWIGGAIALGGIGLLMALRSVPGAMGKTASLTGDALVLLSVILVSVSYVLGGRSSARIGQWPATVWAITIGALVLAPFTVPATMAFEWSNVDSASLAALLFLVLFVTIIGYALWFYALGKAGAAAVAPLQFLQPVLGVMLAIVLLGEAVSLLAVLSGALIVFGVRLSRKG